MCAFFYACAERSTLRHGLLVPNPKGFKRTRDELPIQTRFHKVLPAAVCALFAKRGMDVGMRQPPVGGEDGDEILQEVRPLPYVYQASSVCGCGCDEATTGISPPCVY